MTTKAQLKFAKCSDDGSLNKENFWTYVATWERTSD